VVVVHNQDAVAHGYLAYIARELVIATVEREPKAGSLEQLEGTFILMHVQKIRQCFVSIAAARSRPSMRNFERGLDGTVPCSI